MIVQVVFDMEDDRGPMPLGVYHRTEEDVVLYDAGARGFHAAPEDCVQVVSVEVPTYGPAPDAARVRQLFATPRTAKPAGAAPASVTSTDTGADVAARAFKIAVDAAANTVTLAGALYGPGHSVRA